MASRKVSIEIVGELKAIREKLEEQNRIMQAIAAVDSKEALRVLSDAISGQIVGTSLQGRRLTAGRGSVAKID